MYINAQIAIPVLIRDKKTALKVITGKKHIPELCSYGIFYLSIILLFSLENTANWRHVLLCGNLYDSLF